MSVRIVIALLAVMAPLAAQAQSVVPEPIVRTTIDPSRVMVGRPATLQVEVLVPNYMTSPPELPGFQFRNAATRQLQSVNITEQQGGVEYAGVRFQFAIYPLEPGSYAVDGQKLTIKYAAEPPATREAIVSLPRVEFQAFIPSAAAELNPFLTAASLTIEQTIQRSSEQLKVGDAVTRTITVRAEGVPAMLLPPTMFSAIDGLAVYPAQPSLKDGTVGRSDDLSASRIDSATYMLEEAGDQTLPAIDVRWWNAKEGRIETAHLDAVALQVAANPAAEAAVARSEGVAGKLNSLLDLVAGHWFFAVIAVVALVLLASLAPRLARMIATFHRRRREAWLQSESFRFNQLRHAARRGDASAAYFALLDWLQRFEPAAPLHSIVSLKAAARDPALDQAIDALQTTLFAPPHEAADWSPRHLLRQVGAARRRLRWPSARSGQAAALPPRLNPDQNPVVLRRQWRAPAR